MLFIFLQQIIGGRIRHRVFTGQTAKQIIYL
ncbi:putative conjugative transfer outer membrane protein PilR, partial [Serratia symbiotica str. Tucson]